VGGQQAPGRPAGTRHEPRWRSGSETGLIVKFDPLAGQSGEWRDRLGRNWSERRQVLAPRSRRVRDRRHGDTAGQDQSFAGVGTVLFNMIVNPANGKVYVSNTEARNEVRFEGPGVFGGSTVRGHLHEARITVLDGASVLPRHLNKHIDYDVVPAPGSVKRKSLATPTGMAVTANGATLYVAAFGSSKVGFFPTAKLENDTFVPRPTKQIEVSGGGPSGLALDEARSRLYVLTRFDNSLSVIDTSARTEIAHLPLYNPEPPRW
jgi:YVTN family beta-propeller protein